MSCRLDSIFSASIDGENGDPFLLGEVSSSLLALTTASLLGLTSASFLTEYTNSVVELEYNHNFETTTSQQAKFSKVRFVVCGRAIGTANPLNLTADLNTITADQINLTLDQTNS